MSEDAQAPTAPPTATAQPAWRWAALVLLVVIAYWPVFSGGFVWDDTVLIDRNSLITGEANLLTIWFREDFPLSLVVLWLQWLAWGKNPAGYHIVNVMLHAANALLLGRVLLRMRIPGAWLGAVLFAVHPVAAASVAWISELKNTLSLFCFLVSLDCYLRFDFESRTSRWYWLSFGAFLLALLSKTSTVMLPVVLLASVWWRHGRLLLRDVIRLSPFFVLAFAFGLLTIWFQTHHVIKDQPVQSEVFAARLAGAGWALWFYLSKAVLPLNLSIIYPRWEIPIAQFHTWLPLALWSGLLGICWRCQRGWGRHVLLASGCFTVLLFPVLGFFDMYFFAMSRVSDHLAYLALLPVAATAGALLVNSGRGGRKAGQSAFRNPQPALKALAVVVVLALAALTLQRARVFATDEGLWRDTLAKNPSAWVARNNLGCILAEQNKIAEAAQQFEASLQTNPRNAEAHRNLGKALVIQEQFARAEEHLRTAVKLNPKDAEAQRTLASALTGLDRPEEAIAALRSALQIKPDAATRLELSNALRGLGDVREAVAQLRLAVTAQPDAAEALSNLAWLLATSSDASLRNGAEAVQFSERACQLTSETNALMVAARAAAYAEAERFAEAAASAEKAIALATAEGNTQFARVNQQLLRLYRAKLPYHEPAAKR